MTPLVFKYFSAFSGQLASLLALIVAVVRIPKAFIFQKKWRRAEPIIKGHLKTLLPQYTFTSAQNNILT